MPEKIPAELYDGYMECKVGDCGHIERFFHPFVGLTKMQNHCEEDHGISEDEFVEALEPAESDSLGDTDE